MIQIMMDSLRRCRQFISHRASFYSRDFSRDEQKEADCCPLPTTLHQLVEQLIARYGFEQTGFQCLFALKESKALWFLSRPGLECKIGYG
jgi:hypothetical protein